MDADERLLVQRQIASILDYPSVYMGGPSRGSMGKAERVIEYLERGHRLHGSKCGHGGYVDYKSHGIFCPDCGMQCRDRPEAK